MTHHQQHAGQSTQTNLYWTAVDLPEESRVAVIQTLNRALAATTDLQSQAKFAHWNVKGLDFYQLHLLFDELAETLSEHVDLLAERATALGGQAMGTTRMAARESHIPEPPANAVDEGEYLEWLTDHVAQHANALRRHIDDTAGFGDEDTADLFTELSREVDKYLYFLESHLQTAVEGQVSATGGETGVGGNRPSGGQTGDTPMGDSRMGSAQSSGTRGAGTQSGGAQTGDTQSGGAQTRGRRPAGADGGTRFEERGRRTQHRDW
ncbi:DNA starvation/stationary phase protection protein Dps [Halobacterium zhouii]|uniref:DNA starvation/stationary phase protection protein Dps n=1 Tax=Halobacterium zhouii TaxID=2902624 RepID=UPI001E2A38F4|nr:DNA starvation/stationary phase protection protein Dps [Halobacterium zhouii]